MPIRAHADRHHSTQAWHGFAQSAVEVVIDTT